MTWSFLPDPAGRIDPEVETEADEEHHRDALRDGFVVVEGGFDSALRVPRKGPQHRSRPPSPHNHLARRRKKSQRGAEDAAEGASGHQARGDDDGALAHRAPRLPARLLRLPRDVV